ncbi:MAG: DUF885 domain-containing protein [Armatimonadota bacterium]|nr:DUF885 domain-containing protein [Armatimonadota bacterium]
MATPSPFSDLVRGFVADYLEFYPTLGARLGLHLYDGRTDDYTRPSIDHWLRTLTRWERRLSGLPHQTLPPRDWHDAALVDHVIAYERFAWEHLRDHERNPLWGNDALDVTTYLKRAYAPAPERMRALASHLEHVPGYLSQLRAHLRPPLARPLLETALDIYQGYLAVYTDTLLRALAALDDAALRRRALDAAEGAAAAVRAHLAYLDAARARATETFAIGEELFREMLRAGEMVDVPLDRLLALGEEELARLHDDLRATAAHVAPGTDPRQVMARLGQDHPPAERVLDETRHLLEDLRRFLLDQAIVTIPDDARPRVEETPPFARWAFAMMDTAGPFETVAPESYYYITLPDPAWPPEQREQWLMKFDHATLKTVSIHEAYPGHFVHFFYGVNRADSVAAKVFAAYSFVEGWAHYCEEMMLEAGVDASPQFRLACLSEALVRVVRYLTAIRMHARGMPLEAAAQMFRDQAFMEPVTAEKEAARGTFDPGYLNYTLGKFLLRRLRDDYRAERGPAFSLREFHDRLIALGAPPFPLARRALLARPGERLL